MRTKGNINPHLVPWRRVETEYPFLYNRSSAYALRTLGESENTSDVDRGIQRDDLSAFQ
jgi:hypothetical protein